MFESIRLHLQRVGIDLFVPEPLRAAELDVFWINGRDFFQGLEEASSRITVLQAEGDIGDPVIDPGYGLYIGQWFQVVWIILTAVEKMPIAALQGETERWLVEILDDFNYWRINFRIDDSFSAFLFLLFILRVVRQFPGLREGLQLCRPFYRDGIGSFCGPALPPETINRNSLTQVDQGKIFGTRPS